MGGIIVINNDAGRALRRKPAEVRVAHVLDCTGGFRTGDKVYVTFRTSDGSQFVIATGIVCCDEASLQEKAARMHSLRNGVNQGGDADVVIREQDVELLWPVRP